MIPALRAEWSKLVTTRSFLGCIVAVLVVTVAYATLLGVARGGSQQGQPVYVDNWMALGGIVGGQGVPGIGMAILMIVSALSVTGEYRTGLIQLTFAAVPRRLVVLLAKIVTCGLTCAAVALVLTVISEYSLKWSSAADGKRLGFGGDLRPLYVVPLVVFLAVVFAIALGAIIRNSAAVITLILLWVSGIENIAFFAGDQTANTIRKMLPFSNVQNIVTNGVGALAWSNPWMSVLVFLIWTGALSVIGAAVLSRRDV